jgi:predicted Zn-dependent protease
LEALIRENPGYRDARLQLGFLEVAQKQYQQAEQRFRALYTEEPQDPRGLFGLAETYLAQNQPDKAFQLVSAESRKSSAPETVHSFLAELGFRTSRYDVALDQYTQLLASHPKSAELYSHIAIVYVQKGDLPNAIANFKMAMTLSPHRFTSVALLARTLNQAGRTTEAIQFYRAALKISPQDSLVLNDLAFLIAETGTNLDEALKLAKQAVGEAPGEITFADTLGWIYLKKGQVDSALQVFRNTVRQNPNNTDFRYHLGLALWRAGDKTNAKSELQAALALGPSPKLREEIQELLGSAPSKAQ